MLDHIARTWAQAFGRDFPKTTCRADSSRPETINFLKRHGLPRITGVYKWPNSVEDGIEYLRSFEAIVIHPRCKHFREEARLYSYKVDKMTQEITRDIVDKHNHLIDSTRYALAPMIRSRKTQRTNYAGASYSNA